MGGLPGRRELSDRQVLVGERRSLVIESVLTTILVSVILNPATGSRSIGHNAAIAVWGAVALLGLFASPISSASMNPARTPWGPTSSAGDFTGWWVYVVSDIVGAAVAVVLVILVRGMSRQAERDRGGR